MGGRTVGYSDEASVVSSSSGRSSHSPGVPRHILLRKRVLAIAKYAREQARGGNATLSAADRVRLYGGTTIPVAVPLLPGETEAQHEQDFVRYLAERGYSLAGLYDDPNKERSLRTSFANAKTRDWLRGGSRAGSAAASGKRVRTASFSEDEDDRGRGYGESKRERRDTTPAHAAVALLRTRVLSVSEYRDEVLRGPKLTEGERRQRYGTATEPIPVPLFPGETVDEYEQRFQAHLAHVTVDVSRLEAEPNTERSVRMAFARTRLRGGPPPALTAKSRVVTTEAALDPKPSILSRVSDVASSDRAIITEPSESETPTKLVDAEPEPEDPKLKFPSSCSLQPPPLGSDDAAFPKAYLACGCRKCLLRCTSRLVRQVATLQRDIEIINASSSSSSSSQGSLVMDLTRDQDAAVASPVPPSPAATHPSPRGVDVAKMLQITSLIKSRQQAATSNRMASTSGISTSDDPIEQQLRTAYDEINERVLANERVLESEAQVLALQASGLADHHRRHHDDDQAADHDRQQLEVAARTQDENQELYGYIEEEKDHRDAALALLIVYSWRHAPQALQQRLEQAAASDVAHVTRECHAKMAALATELRELETRASTLKHQLDAVLRGDVEEEEEDKEEGTPADDAERRRLAALQRLGEQLTRAEAAMPALHAARQRELTTVLHFDTHVRALAGALLREAR